MGQVEDGAGPLVQHVGVDAFRPEQRNVALEPHPHLFQAGELAFEHGFALFKASRASRP